MGKLPLVRELLTSQPVVRAWLFGSYSKGKEKENSDIDILVQYNDSETISLFTISRIRCALQKILNKNVDLVEEDCLLPFASKSALKDRVLIYERRD